MGLLIQKNNVMKQFNLTEFLPKLLQSEYGITFIICIVYYFAFHLFIKKGLNQNYVHSK